MKLTVWVHAGKVFVVVVVVVVAVVCVHVTIIIFYSCVDLL